MLQRVRYTDNIQWLLIFIYSSLIVMDEYDGIALCRFSFLNVPLIYSFCHKVLHVSSCLCVRLCA